MVGKIAKREKGGKYNHYVYIPLNPKLGMPFTHWGQVNCFQFFFTPGMNTLQWVKKTDTAPTSTTTSHPAAQPLLASTLLPFLAPHCGSAMGQLWVVLVGEGW